MLVLLFHCGSWRQTWFVGLARQILLTTQLSCQLSTLFCEIDYSTKPSTLQFSYTEWPQSPRDAPVSAFAFAFTALSIYLPTELSLQPSLFSLILKKTSGNRHCSGTKEIASFHNSSSALPYFHLLMLIKTKLRFFSLCIQYDPIFFKKCTSLLSLISISIH